MAGDSSLALDAWLSHRIVALEERFFAWLGAWVGRRPKAAAALVMLVYAALFPGTFLLQGDGKLVYMNLDTEFLTTFTLTDTPEYKNYKLGTSIYPEVRFVSLAESPRNGQSALVADSLRAALDVESHISSSLSISHDGKQYSFEDLCVRASSKTPCRFSSAASMLVGSGQVAENRLRQLELMEHNSSHWPLSKRVAWLVSEIPPPQWALVQVHFGTGRVDAFPGAGASVDALAEWLINSKVLLASFNLQDGEASKLFEREALRWVTGSSGALRVSATTTASLGDECVKIGTSAIPLLGATILTMVAYVVIHLGAETRIPGHTQLMLAVAGCFVPLLASAGSLGLLGYMGIKINILGCMAPFLGLAAGIDCFFLMVTSVNSIGPEERDHEQLMACAVSRGGVAATTTTVTSMAAFITSAITTIHFPGFFSFSLALVFVLFLNWLGMLVLMPAVMVLNERRMLANRRDLFPCVRRSRNTSTADDRPHSIFACCFNLDLGRRGRQAVSHHLAPLIERNLACQLVGATVWMGFVVASAVLLPDLGQGMPDRYFIIDDSPLQVYFDDIEQGFDKTVPMELGLLLQQPQLGDSSYRAALLNLMTELGNRSDAIMPPDCWPVYVAQTLQPSAGQSEAEAATEKFFASSMHELYDWDLQKDGSGTIESARCRFFVWQPMDSKKRSDHAGNLLAVVAQADLPVVAYHESLAIHVARYKRIKQMVLDSAACSFIAVFAALLFFLPVRNAILAVGNVVAVVAVLFGCMTLSGITCNTISFSVCVMAIGFCVDYSCHIVHFADHNVDRKLPWNARMGHSLRECGFDVLQGCATAFLGVGLLAFHGAMAFRIFAALALIITGVGGLFALWCLPALLALVGRIQEALRGSSVYPEQTEGRAKADVAIVIGSSGAIVPS
eukprot:TRINITY_DN11809_c0_g1_i2.p1 TRINITY_DN11809_c0_g1~~TRINITY_DN11809_c0_g1_i2.p1  ORF type:complete len:905 (+),score=127.81 TRINITY_DN11809_c0_g1_i2:73-2787(+)